jgi:hypothetical protein
MLNLKNNLLFVFSQLELVAKIHRVFFLGLICVVFGPGNLQKCCLPSVRTGLAILSSLLAGSFSDK